MKKVAMIGCGKLGQDCAEIMATKYDVVGYDVVPRTPSFPMKDSIKDAVCDRDLIFIAVPTPHNPEYGGESPSSHLPPMDFDYSIVQTVLREVNEHVTSNQLVVLISTVLPGTVRRHLKPYLTNGRFVYNPYLIAMGTIKWDMVNPEMIIIGTEDGTVTGDAKELIEFYEPLMENNPRIEVGTWDEAEAIKVFYNTFISTKIGLVNMIQDVAARNGNMNVDVVTTALAKSTHRITGPAYMKAGLADGGACVLPNFTITVDGVPVTIADLYEEFNEDSTRLVTSASYALTQSDEKKISKVTCRDYDGDVITFELESGVELTCTPEHLIPVFRSNKRILVRADEILESDKIYQQIK